MNTKSLYLNLLKNTLSDYNNIDNPYANGIPPQFWWKKSWFKNLRNKWIVNILRRSNMIVLKNDGYLADERRLRRVNGVDWPLMQAQTMVGLSRLQNIQELLEDVLNKRVEGDILETGVWRGGASILMRAILKVNNIKDKIVWLCDSFEGLPKPEPDKYPADSGDKHYTYDFLSVSVVPTFKDWGQNVDKLVTGGGAYQGSLYGNLGTCDTPRVYRVTYAGGYNPE